jgi:hypothetical protein
MNFFKTLSETGINDVIIQFSKDEKGEVTIIVSPKNIIRNNPLLQIKPIVVTGSPEEVDTTFTDTIVKALTVAQKLHDILEAEKPKEIVKPEKSRAQKIKEISDAQPIMESVSTREEAIDIIKTEKVEERLNKPTPPPVEKQTTVNNEKNLKDFVLTLKTDSDWLSNKEKIEELYANLSEVELGKPYPKKVRIDLDIKLRKQAIIKEARDKMMGIPAPLPKEEQEPIESFNSFSNKELETQLTIMPPPPPPPSLKYTFPAEFDAEDEEEYEEE